MKNFANTGAPGALPEVVARAITEQTIHLTYALDVCKHVGTLLQFIPQEQREAAITSLRNEASDFVQERQPAAAMMLFEMAQSWEDGTQ